MLEFSQTWIKFKINWRHKKYSNEGKNLPQLPINIVRIRSFSSTEKYIKIRAMSLERNP
jgi:hypothetical protein